jgi:hypothetical protein
MEDLHEDTHDDDHGNKVGHIGDGLEGFFEPVVFDGVEAESEDDRDGEACDKTVDGKAEGIPDNSGEHIGVKKLFEVRQTHPGAAPDTAQDGVFLKGDLYSGHGDISENDAVGEGKDKEEI